MHAHPINSSDTIFVQQPTCLSTCSTKRIALIALAIISLLVSAVITWYLYPHIGYVAFSALGGGGICSLLLLIGAYFSKPRRRIPQPEHVEGLKPAQLREQCLKLGPSDTCMVDFSIIEVDEGRVEAKEKVLSFFKREKEMATQEKRAMGVLLGMATGDAIGAHFEFLPYKPEGYFEKGQKIHMTPTEITGATTTNGKGWVVAGQWTDDTSMGLCLADILIEYGTLDEQQLMLAFRDWWHHGYNNAFTGEHPKHSVGLGGNISESFRTGAIKRDGEGTFATNAGTPFTSGNGSLMRLGAVALAASSEEQAMELGWKQSKVTHQGDEAAGCCQLMASLLYQAIHSTETDPEKIKEALFKSLETFNCSVGSVNELAKSSPSVINPLTKKPENWDWKSSTFSFNPERLKAQPGYIGSYAMDALSMALHCIYTTSSFEEAVLKAISHGGDADTVGAITGQLAGAIYGVETLPKDWVDAVHQWDRGGEIATRAYLLMHLHD